MSVSAALEFRGFVSMRRTRALQTASTRQLSCNVGHEPIPRNALSSVTLPIDKIKVYETTVAIIPPDEYWGAIQALRLQLRDSGLYRWPPHINLLYPFVPVKFFPEACSRLIDALREQRPFDITLNELRLFKRKTSATLWLAPEPSIPMAIEHLQVP